MLTMEGGLYPLWFWNAALSPGEIRRQVAEMAAQGVRGFFIHPRQGMQQPYLSDAFFQMVEAAVEAAGKLGLTAHITDDYPYPTGCAGGEVILGNPQFHATTLIQRSYDVAGGPLRLALPPGRVLACMAYPLEAGRVDWGRGQDLRAHCGMVLVDESYNEAGLTAYNRKRYFASRPVPTLDSELPAGKFRLCVSVQAEVERHKYWGHGVDALNPEAVRRFIELTHDRYRARFGERLGRLIGAIFTDETAPGWTDRLPAEFAAICGYDLLPLLPALQDAAHPEHLRVLRDFHDVQYRLFGESFDRPISDWCKAHDVRYAAEKPSLRLAQLRCMDIPGCEPGHTKAGVPMDLLQADIRGNAKATASAAYFYGKEGAMCECLHSLGWSGTLLDARLVVESLLLLGIRYLVLHAFFYSTHSLRKHDAPPSFFFQMPYWPLFGALSARVTRILDAFAGTHVAAGILLVEPTSGIPGAQEREAYVRLQNLLMEEHLDFLMVDTDILQGGEIVEGTVRIRDVRARVALAPPMRVIEAPLRKWLDGFAAAGGIVMHCPCDFREAEVAAGLKAEVRPTLAFTAERGTTQRIQLVTRRAGLRTVWMLLNTGTERADLLFDTESRLGEMPLDDGVPPLLTRDNAGRYRRTLEPFESVLLTNADGAATESEPSRITVNLAGAVTVTPLRPNLLRLGEWDMALLDEQGRPQATARVTPMPLANQIGRGKLSFAPTVVEYFGCAPEFKLPRLEVRYTGRFMNKYGGRVELLMEPDTIAGDWRVAVNDRATIGPGDFAPTTSFLPGCLGYDVTPHLVQGENVIAVQVCTDRPDGGLRNPLYLAGEFGVGLDPPRLTLRPPTGQFDDYAANGLPYYSGVIEYARIMNLAAQPATPQVLVILDTGMLFQDACEISFNGGAWRKMPWIPRRVLVPSGELRAGDNELRVRVYTTLIRAFEGQYFDAATHTTRPAGGTKF